MENYWSFLFIFGAIALAVGPVMMMQPSQRTRRLTALRQEAAQRSIRVRLETLTFAAEKKEVAVYSLLLPSSDKSKTSRVSWTLLKQDYAHGINFYGQWEWVSAKNTAKPEHHAALQGIVDTLDNSIVGLALTPTVVSVYWDEKRLTIDDIEQLLIRCRDQLVSD